MLLGKYGTGLTTELQESGEAEGISYDLQNLTIDKVVRSLLNLKTTSRGFLTLHPPPPTTTTHPH